MHGCSLGGCGWLVWWSRSVIRFGWWSTEAAVSWWSMVGGKVVTKLASERKKRENENTCHRCVERKKVRDRPGKGGIEREVVLLLIAFERVQEAGILSRLVWK